MKLTLMKTRNYPVYNEVLSWMRDLICLIECAKHIKIGVKTIDKRGKMLDLVLT